MLNFLIIEDDEAIRYLLNRMLKKNFVCVVHEAENGELGLRVLLDKMPDLVLLDISMPVMDGIETLKIIRANPIFKKIPVMVITAMSDRKAVESLAEIGITDFILKPIDLDESIRRIQKIIKRLSEAKEKNTLQNKPGRLNDFKIDHILIVDDDTKFVQFFKSLLGNQFLIHDAVRGSNGFEVYSHYRPKHVFISDKLTLLDKKILTQKIRELFPDNEVSIYLLVDDLQKLSTKIFIYDGIVKKTIDKKEFMNNIDFLKIEFADTLTAEK